MWKADVVRTLIAIDGPQADAIRKADGFFAPDVIPADTYKGIGAVKTLAVGAQWVTSEKADANTVSRRADR